MGADIINIRLTTAGDVDIKHLEAELKVWHQTLWKSDFGFGFLKMRSGVERPKIGCFSAASNITGQLVDVDCITKCLHSHGALAFWDYATAGPYVDIDMNPIFEG